MTAQPIDGPAQGTLDLDVERVAPPVETEVDALLAAGESAHAIAARLGMKLESLRKHLHRHGRTDLLDRLSAVATGTGGAGGIRGARLRMVPAQRVDEERAAPPVELTEEPETLPCSREDPEVFFSPAPQDQALAVAVCDRCPAREACLTGALARKEPWGVWGGRVFVAGHAVALKGAS